MFVQRVGGWFPGPKNNAHYRDADVLGPSSRFLRFKAMHIASSAFFPIGTMLGFIALTNPLS